MDGSHYHYPTANGIHATSAPQTYPSPTAVAPNQLQTGSPLPQTLPPLQPPSTMQPIYGSHPHTPRTPGTPNTPNSANNLPSYHQTSQPAGRGGLYSMAQNPYPHHQGYGTSAPMMPQTSAAASHPQPIAPAPVGGRGPPVLRPMPPGGLMSQPGVSQPYGANSLMQPNSVLPEGEQPTHVVGSQGRRGILPSAPGRPAPPAPGTGANKNAVIPVKDADGKFPCPHCTKTYLHAKHLKRHLLRHTGDRPYMCVLCRDTFSRSDILKRHFQKCSIRRGNPTGASHLSHPLAHVKKNSQAQKAGGLGQEGDLNHMNGMNNMPGDGMVQPFGMVPVQDGMNNMAGGDQSHLSRSSSMGRLENGNAADRTNMPGNPPVMGASQPYGGDGRGTMNHQHMPNYNMPSGQNGMPMYSSSNANQQSGLDWAQMFPGAHQSYASNCNSFSPNVGETQIGTKTEPKPDPAATTTSPGLSGSHLGCNLPANFQNPFSHLSNQILNFLYPPNQEIDPQTTGLNLYFSPDNIQDFLHNFTHFSVHAPLLHLPSFKVMEAYTGLVALMCCIGACYSERLEPANVREMMDFVWAAAERDCGMMNSESSQQAVLPTITKRDIEELQTMLLMVILNCWNGTPQQRNRARQMFPTLASQARRLNLTQVRSDSFPNSPLHQPGFCINSFDPHAFDWQHWIEQERRVRLMFGILLGDAMMALYFNLEPFFDPFEVRLPLPCDDAAWDAQCRSECAAALGLYGPKRAMDANPYGTRQAKQPENDQVLKALVHASVQIQPGTTNLYGKFILIHEIITLIRQAQVAGNEAQMYNHGTPPPHEWLTRTETSGRATPVEGVSRNIAPRTLQALSMALDKFKANWDADMRSQFPPATSVSNKKRQGFSRDGIHFYWLAKYMLKYTRQIELEMRSDARLLQILQLMRGVVMWVMNDGAARGEELGSVGDMDSAYGTTDLTLEMAQLFKPLPHVVEDAGTVSVKTEMGS